MSKKKEQFCPDCGEKSYHLVRHRNTGICKAKQIKQNKMPVG
jgi:hypothetical protein